VILFLGDSINRYMVEEFCDNKGGLFTKNWGVGFHKEKRLRASSICIVEHAKIGFLHVYGSEKVGPYLDYLISDDQSYDFTDTIVRIPEGIRQFTALVGATPDFIIYRTDLWDLAQFSNSTRHYFYDADIAAFEKNRTHIISRFIENHLWGLELISQISPTSYIGTHTIPRIRQDLHLFDHYENAVRYISKASGIFLFDWNLQFVNLDPTTYLRDFTHPSYWYASGFLEYVIKVLQRWSC